MNGFFKGSGTNFGITFSLKSFQKSIPKSITFLFKKSLKIDPKITSFWEGGGSNEPAFRSLNPCWGQPGARGAPGPPQRRPRYRPENQKLQKSLKMIKKSRKLF